MNAEQLPYLLAFNSILKLSARRIREIIDYFQGDVAFAWSQPGQWKAACSGNSLLMDDILSEHKRLAPEQLYAQYLDSGAQAVTIYDEDYPVRLRDIYDPPPILLYHGQLPAEEDICLGMIGSRNASAYGRQVAEILSRDLAFQDLIVVSGMARGIDSICHKGALDAGGRTIAVLGSGLDVVYPRENEQLYQDICSNGTVISEFPLGTGAVALNFPRRNRIISGLSHGIIVVEAGEKSGTLLTVDYALQQGRDIFAVPGPITSPTSRGTNRLLKEGAKIARSAADICEEYIETPLKKLPRNKKKDTKSIELSDIEKKLLGLLILPMQFDEIVNKTDSGFDASRLSSLLTMMEIRGLVKHLPGNNYQAIIKRID